MASKWIDFKALRQKVTIRQVLDRYGFTAQLQEKGAKLVGPCPVHKGKSPTAFHVALDKGIWNCFSGPCKGGNVLDLVMAVEGCEIREAGVKLARWFDLSFDRKKSDRATDPGKAKGNGAAPAPARQESEGVNPPLQRSLTLNQDHRYLVDRGLTVETIKKFGVGYCSRGIMRGRIAIPIHNEKGDLVAYAGRAVDEAAAEKDGKYKLPTGFSKGHVLYNLHRAQVHVDIGLILVEGFFDAMRVHQAGYPNVVALMGCSLSEQQAKLLAVSTDRLAVMMDADDAGAEARKAIWRELNTELYLRSVLLPKEGDQPDKLTEEQLKALLDNV